MKTSIKNIIMFILIVTVFSSCNYGETLQAYFVTHQEESNFISVDIPTSFVKLNEEELTEDQVEAYESIDKLNMLGYRLNTENVNEFNVELEKVKVILKDDRYQDLMRGGNTTDGRFVIKYIGDDDSIDELILFGSATDKGFAIVRVLGNNMKPEKIATLGNALQNATTDENNVKEIMEFFQ